MLWGVVAAGLRTRLRVALHVRAAHVPFGSDLADVFPLADLIVTESAFGARAVSFAAREQGMTLRCSPVAIPPLLDPGLRTAHVDDRTATRRAWDIPPTDW
ncbi:MAG: hypothetical protein IT180_03325 [Acidobacteria bacterium]|nr:hypothetical protein [Acidobacteriota bacterium]